MDSVIAAVARTSSVKNCFMSVSPSLTRRLNSHKFVASYSVSENQRSTILVFKISWPPNCQMFVSWSGDTVVSSQATPAYGQESDAIIEISRKFSHFHGLKDGQQVVVEHVDLVPSCAGMHVDPVSVDDWEILELHAGFLESNFLHQVRVVWCGQIVPIWINKSTSIAVKIKMTEPNAPCVMLEEFSEVVIAPQTRKHVSQEHASIAPHAASLSGQDTSKFLQRNHENEQSEKDYEYFRDHRLPESSVVSDILNYFRGFFDGTCEDTNLQRTIDNRGETGNDNSVNRGCSTCTSSMDETARGTSCCKGLFEASKLDINLRVQCNREINEEHSAKTMDMSAERSEMSPKRSELSAERSELSAERSELSAERSELSAERSELSAERSEMSVKRTEMSAEEEQAFFMCLKQITTVCVSPSSIPLDCLFCGKHSVDFPRDCTGWTKIVSIKKILSPSERAQMRNVSTKKNKVDESVNEKNGKEKEDARDSDNQSSSLPQDTTFVKLLLTNDTRPHRTRISPANPQVLTNHITLDTTLQRQLGTQIGSVLKVENVEYSPAVMKGIILHPASDDSMCRIQELGSEVVVGAFKAWLSTVSSDECPLVSGNKMTIHVPCEDSSLLLVLSILSHSPTSSIPPYFLLSPKTLDQVDVVLGEKRSSPSDVSLVKSDTTVKLFKCRLEDLGGVSEPFQESLDHLLVSLDSSLLARQLSGGQNKGLASGALLLHGTSSKGGSGRTSLAHALCEQLSHWPVCAHVVIVECIPLRSKRVETIQKHWQRAFTESAWHQPSVLLLDDLDHVISCPSPTQEIGGEALYRLRLAQVFKDLVANEIANKTNVAVIATSRSRDTLHSSLLSARGSHVFQKFVELSPPNESKRAAMLSSLLDRKFANVERKELFISSVARKTEGYSPKDLALVTERALHFARARRQKDRQEEHHISVTEEDYQQALTGFKPAALRGVPLHQAGSLGWQDVGGLGTVKDTLRETLLWPTKFARVFAKCPLRLRSGLLLYGPPGTGKTLLAGVVAKECGLNFISIKGPELLSKYIGASEQAVRDMFARAESAKPCILFFDEFDALAPRRGHDSTGVTDRVVNQLLTQLDGVEGLQGVYVLGATSRPDLIDPALLRPGRLDKCIYCPIPNESDRFEIIQALSRELPLADDVRLQSISQRCSFFTGADLKALLYNAQLEAIHRSTSRLKLYGKILSDDINNDRTELWDIPERTSAVEKGDTVNRLQTEGAESPKNSQGVAETRRVLVATVREGVRELCEEEAQSIEAEIDTIKRNRTASKHPISRTQSSEKVDSVLLISQLDLEKALKSMGPSVSEMERFRYQNIYESFVKSRGGSFTQEALGQGRTTLA